MPICLQSCGTCSYYTTTATTQDVWYLWNSTAAYTTTASTQTIWTNWAATTATYSPTVTVTYANEAWGNWVYQPSYGSQVALTPEQQQAQREATERYEAARRAKREERAAARARARILLGEFLTGEQKVELAQHGHFHVTGSKGRRYCIRASGQSGNVDLLNPDGSVRATLCCHPRSIDCELLPEGDAWLVQMMAIRHDEDEFLRTANVHRGSLRHLALR